MLPYILLGLLTISFCVIILLLRRNYQKVLEKSNREHYEKGSKVALETSRRVIKGRVSEHLVPLLGMKKELYCLSDWRYFGGEPIDYIVFDGMTDARDGDGEFKEILFVDIKTGKARLSPHQKRIKQAVTEGKVRWVTLRLDDEGNLNPE